MSLAYVLTLAMLTGITEALHLIDPYEYGGVFNHNQLHINAHDNNNTTTIHSLISLISIFPSVRLEGEGKTAVDKLRTQLCCQGNEDSTSGLPCFTSGWRSLPSNRSTPSRQQIYKSIIFFRVLDCIFSCGVLKKKKNTFAKIQIKWNNQLRFLFPFIIQHNTVRNIALQVIKGLCHDMPFFNLK